MPRQRFSATRARSTSRRSLLRCLWKVVNNTIKPGCQSVCQKVMRLATPLAGEAEPEQAVAERP
jgi:hypothetical protein